MKLVYNTMFYSCWANHVKNVLLLFNSGLQTSCKKANAGYNPFQWSIIILIHLTGLHTDGIFDSTARKILPQDWNKFFSSKKELTWKSHLEEEKKRTKVLVGGLPLGRAGTVVGVFRNFRVVVGASPTKGNLGKISLLLILRFLAWGC